MHTIIMQLQQVLDLEHSVTFSPSLLPPLLAMDTINIDYKF